MPSVLEPNWVGRRVTVRRVLRHEPDGRERYGDVVGELVGLDPAIATVQTRHGRIEIERAGITVARLVTPSTADELALEGIAAAGWRPEETAQVGGWLLRASRGFTARGNSVLPLRAPGVALDDALARARGWYAERGLTVRIHVPVHARRLLDAGLAERGWTAEPDVHVLTARLDTLAAAPTTTGVRIHPAPDESWLARYRGGAGLDPAARALLTRHERAAFASVSTAGRDAAGEVADGTEEETRGEIIAIGRGVVDGGWLGISAVEVAPARRRRGLAVDVVEALHAWGRAQGASHAYLQVSSDNAPALALYAGLGYHHHHDYRYRVAPSSACCS
jgi:ribosomal protein S18 acetylase RimI-like enzyme